MELLLTAFVGTAAEELVKGIEGCTVLLLPNDKKADGVLLRGELVRKRYDIVLALGQKEAGGRDFKPRRMWGN